MIIRGEEGWQRIGFYDLSGRRALWMRLLDVSGEVSDGYAPNIRTVEFCSGREGDDAYLRVHRDSTSIDFWDDLLDVFLRVDSIGDEEDLADDIEEGAF